VSPMTEKEGPTEQLDYAPEPWVLRRCLDSDLVFLENPPDYDAFVEDFAWEVTSEKTSQARKQAEPVLYAASSALKRFRTHTLKRNKVKSLTVGLVREIARNRPGGEIRLLDIGCGWGGLLASVLQELDPDVRQRCVPFGIELSKELARISTEKFDKLRGGRCINATALDGIDGFDENFFDIIVMSSFLEHEINPLPLLRRCHARMKQGGVIVIKVPNFASINRSVRGRKWAGFRWPDHVNYFTPSTLRNMAEKAGFAIRRMKLADRFPLSDSMYAVLSKP
jgi:SAM-dependent methyltransferase